MSSGKFALPILAASVLISRSDWFQLTSLESYIQQEQSYEVRPEVEFVEEHGWRPFDSTDFAENRTEEVKHNVTNTTTSQLNSSRFPYVAFLYFEQRDKAWRCGGTLIEADVVMTAAHCIPRGKEHYSSVTLGGIETYDDNMQESFEMMQYEIHPHFEVGGYPMYDIALVRIDRCSEKQPINLNQDSFAREADGSLLHVLRWEDSFDEEGYEDYTIIRESPAPLDKTCNPWRKRTDLGEIRKSHICTQASHLSQVEAPTKGDSGGALIIKGSKPSEDIQVGVISFGYNRAVSQLRPPTVHSDVGSSFDWINNTTQMISKCL